MVALEKVQYPSLYSAVLQGPDASAAGDPEERMTARLKEEGFLLDIAASKPCCCWLSLEHVAQNGQALDVCAIESPLAQWGWLQLLL